MTLNLVHTDLLTTVAELRDVASTLEAERRRTDLAVDVLLDGGWSGRAAAAYLEGWEDWRTGCDQVLAALASMAELIALARADQVERDEQAAAGLRALAGDLLAKVDGGMRTS
ncbi:WXG100 family type VII secretion target [Nocardioides sp.]|uniref:WXG100 family type VII secretion target n=1 Tax=Nocardioides sp. TaxID=35761 RepID=UPI002727C13F|nr:WXG100 family type VII secretion target [Nocardioides sp.]MDO9456586.1 WXG100 family type VII secretion target [Nocardioides sp.]